MIYYLLLLLSIVLAVLKISAYNNYAKTIKPDAKGIFSFNAVAYGVAVVAALCSGIGSELITISHRHLIHTFLIFLLYQNFVSLSTVLKV